MELKPKASEKVYFASDFHLGIPNKAKSREREQKIIDWLSQCQKDAHAIFLVGDLFDFWFEYKTTIPKGFSRFQGKLAEIADSGIELHIFTGNHDLWMFGYFEEEFNAKVYTEPIDLFINQTSLYVGHGDGLGPGDKGYKFLKKVFTNRFFQWAFHWLHPNVGIGLANFWSGKSRAQANNTEQRFLGEEEWLWSYAKSLEKEKHRDYYIFGHRHLPLDLEVGNNSRYINLGEWLGAFTYAEYAEGKVELKTYEG
ncbi:MULTISPECIES: UDP-2,3-diacylglucosamine diphosphatase [Roseivirga]|jgi:UDP-2,3-diacylglucosamine hydrolase|uniref:UDP-2,3-diacylglucosamine diphosphatase n=1 Tax=Roseivirga TaxID=290180 RepID=UPI00257A31EC|nr:MULTISPECIES: UDP-2,3-diacylglucosamine diphosphatase [Roseivirga]MEC7754187.1 UDP-2,3-diacylglucosamine diphosphatase [Bacteroidota bacterium]|tara:strand:+ start:41063 stop:41824 length:762 start_codon:yes stop_codon:yes gene_type:complete